MSETMERLDLDTVVKVSEAISGETARFDLFSTMSPLPFPGGAALRGPLYVLGMLWYAMRDRLRQ